MASFRVYFQLNEDSWGYQVNGRVISPQIVSCPDDQVYVPYYNDCEPVYCSGNTYPYRGRCLLKERLVADPAMQPFPNGTTRFFITASLFAAGNQTTVEAKTTCQAYFQSRISELAETSQLNVSLGGLAMNRLKAKALEHNQTVDFLSLSVAVDVHNASLHEVVVFSQGIANGTFNSTAGAACEVHEVVVSNLQNIPDDWECPNGTLKELGTRDLKVDDSQTYFLQTHSSFFNLENIGFQLRTFSTDNASLQLLQVTVCGDLWPIHCHLMGYIYLNATDFLASNDTLVVENTGETFNESQFVVFDNGSAIVCSVYNSSYTVRVVSFALMKDYLLEGTMTVVTLSVSILCLVLVLLTYTLLPQLRNVPGVIVMSYSGSLLGYQAMCLLAVYPRGWLCVLHACLFHACLLSSFLWKSVLSFDLLFMLRLKSIESSSHASRARMLNCYSVVGWLLPALLVLLLWLLDYFSVFVVHYGSAAFGVCWLGSLLGNLYYVLLPLAVTWLFNVVCFALALRLIHQTGRTLQGKAARTKAQRARERRRLLASVRISMLMGLAWITCFVAAAVGVDQLWMAHIVLNGAQGFDLLICFVLKPRVLSMLRDRLARRAESSAARSGVTSEMTTTSSFSSIVSTSVATVPSARMPGDVDV